tara:strand:- start:99 stop:494 length:396 start_codon:yes stop_codon:yes gene_type:complete
MSSVLNVDTIANKAGSGPVALTKQSAAKAWVNYTLATSTTARDSFNISSLTDAGTGLTNPISFTSSMVNNDYSGSHFANAASAGDAYTNFANDYVGGFGTFTTNSYGTTSYDSDSYEDGQQNCDIIIGDLA